MTAVENPEEFSKQKLTSWLETNGANVYWEKKNDWSHPIFKIEGDGHPAEKPDLLILFNSEIYAVEVKSGNSKSEVYDSHWQVMRYWTNYVTRQEHDYVLSGTVVDIDGFLTATKWSIEGHLFPPSTESLLTEKDFGSGRKNAILRGDLPPSEYNMTEQHIRNLWRHMKSGLKTENAPTVGSLLSTALHPNQNGDNTPAVLVSDCSNQNWQVKTGSHE